MSKLREKKESKAALVVKMESLLNEATTRGDENLTSDEEAKYSTWETEVKELDAEILSLEKFEERKKELALQTAKKDDVIVDNIKTIAGDLEGKKSPTSIELKNDRKATKEALHVNTFKLIKGMMSKNHDAITDARKELAEGGHYDDLLKGKDGVTKGFNTLVDTDGGILVPSTITSQVMDIMQDYGVIPRLALNLGDISQSSVKIPQILGRPSFTAVGQGQAITGSDFNLGAIELKAHKWGSIINWTNEVSDSVGARLMPIIMNKIAEGYAYAQDNAFFNGDGTSTYNGIQGLEGLTGTVNYVRTATAPSGNVSYETLDANDFILPQENVAPGARAGCVYVMHPNLIFALRKLQDGQGKYIYGDPSEVAQAGTLWGYPIETSEAFNYNSSTTQTALAFFNPRYLAYATGRNLSADELREGTITDEDSNSVNLATTDQKALRFTGLFDLFMSSVTRSTAGTAQGAFSVLRTAAS